MPPTRIKVCGVTRLDDALMLEQEGVDSIGFNFVATSPRCITADVASSICARLHPATQTVAVVANGSAAEVRSVLAATGIAWAQFHGDEPPERVAQFLPHAYKAIPIREANDAEAADLYPGEHILVDAKVEGLLGGTGQVFDWRLVTELARRRKVTLAGGLTPENVARAIETVQPYCVDVASGVESSPGVKDARLVRAFVQGVRLADRGLRR
jgi:phosphoribosylanthranilate isomerase